MKPVEPVAPTQNININDEYSVLHSMASKPVFEVYDEFDMGMNITRPYLSKRDPDIPLEEDNEVQKHFPFVRSIDYGKPIETRLRASIRTKQDFDSIEKLNDLGPEEVERRRTYNPYTVNKALRKASKGGFGDDPKVLGVFKQNDSWLQSKSIAILERNNPQIKTSKDLAE